MRTLLVEDEAGARAYLRNLLTAFEEIEIVAEAEDGLAAISLVNRLAPDLVFLDVQMPVLDGFEILPYFKHQPMIVFCTAYDRYALRAFEVNALDYLMKPVDPERLARCLEKIRNEWDKISSMQAHAGEDQSGMRHVVCHRNGVYQLLWLNQTAMFYKEGRYTAVRSNAGEVWFTDLTMEQLAQKLNHPHFFRLNRGVILCRDAIRSFRAKAVGGGRLITVWEEELAVSRGRMAAFRTWFNQAD